MVETSVVQDRRKLIATRAGIGAIVIAAITALFPLLVMSGPDLGGELGYFGNVAMAWIWIGTVLGPLIGVHGMGLQPYFVVLAIVQYVGVILAAILAGRSLLARFPKNLWGWLGTAATIAAAWPLVFLFVVMLNYLFSR